MCIWFLHDLIFLFILPFHDTVRYFSSLLLILFIVLSHSYLFRKNVDSTHLLFNRRVCYSDVAHIHYYISFFFLFILFYILSLYFLFSLYKYMYPLFFDQKLKRIKIIHIYLYTREKGRNGSDSNKTQMSYIFFSVLSIIGLIFVLIQKITILFNNVRYLFSKTNQWHFIILSIIGLIFVLIHGIVILLNNVRCLLGNQCIKALV